MIFVHAINLFPITVVFVRKKYFTIYLQINLVNPQDHWKLMILLQTMSDCHGNHQNMMEVHESPDTLLKSLRLDGQNGCVFHVLDLQIYLQIWIIL